MTEVKSCMLNRLSPQEPTGRVGFSGFLASNNTTCSYEQFSTMNMISWLSKAFQGGLIVPALAEGQLNFDSHDRTSDTGEEGVKREQMESERKRRGSTNKWGKEDDKISKPARAGVRRPHLSHASSPRV